MEQVNVEFIRHKDISSHQYVDDPAEAEEPKPVIVKFSHIVGDEQLLLDDEDSCADEGEHEGAHVVEVVLVPGLAIILSPLLRIRSYLMTLA